jgi:2-dehydropantoate 2-reductase
MDICVFGAGAVGGYLAGNIINGDAARVSLIARGDHLRAMQRDGLKIISTDGEFVAKPARLSDRVDDLPPQDIIFVTLKANALSACAADILKLLKPNGHAVFVTNGIPWWWNYGLGPDGTLRLLDPTGDLWNGLTPARVLGCVVYAPNEVIAPGVVRHTGHDRWLVGEPNHSISERLEKTVGLLKDSHLNAAAVQDLRREVWLKLLRNTALNSVCTLTRLPIDGISAEPSLVSLVESIIDEIIAIAKAQGWDIEAEAEPARRASQSGGSLSARVATGIRPSMLQDALAGRPMEVDAIVGQVQVFAQQAGVPCPSIDHVLALLRGLQLSTT